MACNEMFELILNDDKRWDSKNYMKKDFLEYTGAKRGLSDKDLKFIRRILHIQRQKREVLFLCWFSGVKHGIKTLLNYWEAGLLHFISKNEMEKLLLSVDKKTMLFRINATHKLASVSLCYVNSFGKVHHSEPINIFNLNDKIIDPDEDDEFLKRDVDAICKSEGVVHIQYFYPDIDKAKFLSRSKEEDASFMLSEEFDPASYVLQQPFRCNIIDDYTFHPQELDTFQSQSIRSDDTFFYRSRNMFMNMVQRIKAQILLRSLGYRLFRQGSHFYD